MGYNPQVFKEAQQLEGYQGDKRENKAHIIIPRRQVGVSSNDVGFERSKNGFKLHASEYDAAWRTGFKIKKLKQTYAEKQIIKTIKSKSKYSIKNRIEVDGKIKMTIRCNLL